MTLLNVVLATGGVAVEKLGSLRSDDGNVNDNATNQ